MKLEKLQFVVEDGVGIITMNYMKNLNAIDDQMADELMYVVNTCENDPNVKVVVLKGMPKAFSAGGDIGYFYNLIQQGGEVNMDSLISKVGNVTDGLKRMSKLVISSVSGAAAGAGVSLAFSGDFVVCADNAKFIMAFVNLGLVFTGQPMEGKYDIDHFIPWSFVMNDELWNLMPMDASLNSSKSNRLPKWNPFFQNFAQNQYLMYQMIYDDMRIYLGRTRIISKR